MWANNKKNQQKNNKPTNKTLKYLYKGADKENLIGDDDVVVNQQHASSISVSFLLHSRY